MLRLAAALAELGRLTRRVSQSRSRARSTFADLPRPAPPGRRSSTTRPVWPGRPIFEGMRSATRKIAATMASRRSSPPTSSRYHGSWAQDEAGAAKAVRARRDAARPVLAGLGGPASSRRPVTAALARLGLLPEAYYEARTGLAINPTFSIPRFRASTASDNPTAVAGRERIIDGLRKAGVSET